MNVSHDALEVDDSVAVTPENTSRFFSVLKQADFWNMSPEQPSRGLDAADSTLDITQECEKKFLAAFPSSRLSGSVRHFRR